jgi:tRNA threonylcarbamoyladenosine biosynthesis protein TsaB
MILAIDTATQYAGLALYNQDGVFAEEFWYSGRNHTIELMPRVERLLRLAQLPVSGLAALAVSLGPGSFTGLRIGLAAAKGLALPHKLPVVGIPTLDIVAYPFCTANLPVWAVAQAGRGRILAACYGWVDDEWLPFIEPYLTNFAELAANIDQPALCTGEIDQEAADQLTQDSNRKAQVVSAASRVRRAAYLAEIAAARLAENDQDDPDALVPIYLSNP